MSDALDKKEPALRGITWAHTRGYLPLVAAAQRYEETHPGLEIFWEKRSLRDFEAFPVGELARRYDLMVIDHPFIGHAARDGVFLPLDEYLDPAFLADQSSGSVGASHASYQWNGQQLALAIDAAAPVMAWRPDRLEKEGLDAPETWAEVMRWARQGRVEVPAVAINCLMDFYGLCVAAGERPFTSPEQVVDRDVGLRALSWLGELLASCDYGCTTRNPIQSLELLASDQNSSLALCLFPYGYSNYSRDGYARHPLVFGDLPSMEENGPRLTTTLGGTGLAVSAFSSMRNTAVGFARYVAEADTQRTLFTHAGGQPAHRRAWLDPENNRRTRDYFSNTLPSLDRAFVRPRHDGYLHGFQDPASEVLHAVILGKMSAADALGDLDRLWRACQVTAQ